jgi:hypothetical protein
MNMKILSKFLLATMLAMLLIFQNACRIDSANGESKKDSEVVATSTKNRNKPLSFVAGFSKPESYISNDLNKVIEMKKLSDQVKAFSLKQNGVCDTCVSGYQSVIIENRLVVAELSRQTAELQAKIVEIDKLKSDSDKVIDSIKK